MAKKNTVSDESAAIELLQAQNEALAAEVAELGSALHAERQARREASMSSGSARIFTSEDRPAPPELPVVDIGGLRFRFRLCVFCPGAEKHTALGTPEKPDLLNTILEKYPSLLEAL